MAITYPRELPVIGMSSIRFELRRFMAQNQLAGGATDVIDLAESRWWAEFTTRPMRRRDAQAFAAWFNSLRGGLEDFLGYDMSRCFPIEYASGFAGINRAAGGAFPGTATVTARTGHTLSLSGLPANFQLRAGDLVGLTQTVGGVVQYGLHEIQEDVTGDAGGAATLTVEPAILTNVFTTAAQANFAKPKCRMTIDQNSRSFVVQINLDPFSFSGIQKVI